MVWIGTGWMESMAANISGLCGFDGMDWIPTNLHGSSGWNVEWAGWIRNNG